MGLSLRRKFSVPRAVGGRAEMYASGKWALLTFLLLLCVVLSLWRNSVKEVTIQAGERFNFRVSELQSAIRQRLLAYEHVLRGGVGLFAASVAVTRDEWRSYVYSLAIDRHYPGIQGIGFSLRLKPEQLQMHIQGVRAEGFSDYRLWPEGTRTEYTAIVYLEPFDWRNRRAFGYDMFSEPVRREAMVRARDTGAAAASGKVTLVQETDKEVQYGFLMYLPVYPRGIVPVSMEARQAALIGYVYSPFRMGDLMEGILEYDRLPDIHLQIFDGGGTSPGNLMFDSQPEGRPEGRHAIYVESRDFDVNGRRWTLVYRSLPAFVATTDQQRPLVILISGLLVSILFAVVVWSLTLNRRRAQELGCINSGLQNEIAERKKLAEALERAKNDAESANRAKSEFLASVSHEIRTPLTLILAPLEGLFAEEPAGGERTFALERIRRNALLLLNRVNEILDFAKAESGKFEPYWERVDLCTWLEPLIGDAALSARRKGCALSAELDPRLGKIAIDIRLFEKIAMNLVSNALKFTPADGRIRIELGRLDDGRFEFAVVDTGPGIAREQQALLFQRFHQIKAASTRRHGGTGIGLALVRELTELMGGEVGVQSESGQGARFYVRLPVSTGDDLESERKSTVEVGGQPPDHQLMLRRARLDEGTETVTDVVKDSRAVQHGCADLVLVADDTADMRAYIVEQLQDRYEVLTAEDGEQAWQLLQRHPVDLLVSDVMMPELDGLGLTARIKASSLLAHLPVILLTARGDASVSGFEAGADDYIAKPFSPDELRARVYSALRMARIQTELRDKSREAGMAMLATGILHNLGNALNGVTVTTDIIREKLLDSRASCLQRCTELLRRHADDLPGYFSREPESRLLPEYLDEVRRQMESERMKMLKEVEALRDYTEHATAVVKAHQKFTAATDIRESVLASSLMDLALKLGMAACGTPEIVIVRRYRYREGLTVDRHKALQILINLLLNACQALSETGRHDKRIKVRIAEDEGRVLFEVSDNGVGIDRADQPRLFTQGYTTRGEGHGLGLHLSANWAREMQGTLECASRGVGQGAAFKLLLPID